MALRRRLARAGFSARPPAARTPGRWLLEIFPHPAQVALFGRARIVKYKKGPVAARRAGLAELQAEIARHLPALTPSLDLDSVRAALLAPDPAGLAGRALKGLEDRLDALVCAFMAAYYWRWGARRCTVHGDPRAGYIICPRLDVDHHPGRGSRAGMPRRR